MEKMGSAKNWGIFDMNGRADFSAACLSTRKSTEPPLISRRQNGSWLFFKRELEDVSISEDFSVGIGGWTAVY